MNPLVEFSSREELAEMAGYGEEKLSTVLVSGTVLCEACSDDQNGLTNPQTVSGSLCFLISLFSFIIFSVLAFNFLFYGFSHFSI